MTGDKTVFRELFGSSKSKITFAYEKQNIQNCENYFQIFYHSYINSKNCKNGNLNDQLARLLGNQLFVYFSGHILKKDFTMLPYETNSILRALIAFMVMLLSIFREQRPLMKRPIQTPSPLPYLNIPHLNPPSSVG